MSPEILPASTAENLPAAEMPVVSSDAVTTEETPVLPVEKTEQTLPDITVQQQPMTGHREEILHAGHQLHRSALRAARADVLDRGAQVRAAKGKITNAAVAGLGAAAWAGFPVAGLLMAAAVAERARIIGLYKSQLRNTELPDGYTLQPLRIANPSDRMATGRVAVAVHPRDYHDSPEPKELTQKRLADALDTVDAALGQAAGNAPSPIGYVIIPSATAMAAGLPYGGKTPYRTAISDMTAQNPELPYKYNKDTALIVPADKARELADLMRGGNDHLVKRVFMALAERYPGKQDMLTLGHPGVVGALHGILERITSSNMGTRINEVVMEGVARVSEVDGKKVTRFYEVPTGAFVRSRDGVDTAIHGDRFNPRLNDMTSTKRTQLRMTDLRTLTGDETMYNIGSKLEAGTYEDIELVRVALQLLERRQPQDDHAADPELTATPAVLPKGEPPIVISLAEEQPNMATLRTRFAGRIAVLATVIMAGISLLDATGGALENRVDSTAPPRPPSTTTGLANADAQQKLKIDGPTGAVRIDNHGLTEQSPYWHENLDYSYGNPRYGWRTAGLRGEVVPVPAEMPDANRPHLKLTFFSEPYMVSLPIEDGTAVAALRAYAPDGEQLPTELVRLPDGSVHANVAASVKDGTIVKYEYDLVADRDGDWETKPSLPLSVAHDVSLKDALSYPGAQGNTQTLANYTEQNFTYDSSPVLAIDYTRLTHGSPSLIVPEIYKQQKGDCTEVNGAIAMLSARLWPLQELAVVNGYYHLDHVPSNGHSYLQASQAHTWLNNGENIDGTPRSATGQQPRGTQTTAALDATWTQAIGGLSDVWLKQPPQKPQRPVKFPTEALVGLLAAGVFSLEMRGRYLQRAAGAYLRWDRFMTAALDIDPRDAVQILQWRAYGRPATDTDPGSTMPQPSGGENYRGENPRFIPSSTLAGVASRELAVSNLNPSQRRGLRHTASAIAAWRAYEDRQRKQTTRKR